MPPWVIVTTQFVSPAVRKDNSKRFILSWIICILFWISEEEGSNGSKLAALEGGFICARITCTGYSIRALKKRGSSDATLTSAQQANVQHVVQSVWTFSTPGMSALSGRWALLTPLDALATLWIYTGVFLAVSKHGVHFTDRCKNAVYISSAINGLGKATFLAFV